SVGGLLALPIFDDDRPEGASDFNDMATLYGLEAVTGAIASAKPPAAETANDQSTDSRGENNAAGKARSPVVKINVTGQHLPRVTTLAWDALIAANDPPEVFRHGSLAARIETDDDGYPIIREMTLDRMRHRLARVASWYEKKNKNRVATPTKPPLDVVRDVLATPDLPLPVLSYIIEAPIFAGDGTLQTNPGYHPATQNYYATAADFVITHVPEKPSAS